ncbi:DNA-3-methyladenine glycosylase family protein [Bacillus testis]|uniref:DNA-3-methyladenine glycosylase family protein n=1 Tax=Bacillus testis TaxID=1622072 RepID=UPI00067F4B01|nr:DNA-3-methyladenine glycosylase [Bacillus testis]
MWKETLIVEGPYYFEGVLDRLLLDPLQAVDLSQRTIKVPLFLSTGPHVITVQACGSTEDPSFLLSGNQEESRLEAIQRIEEIFGWRSSLKGINEHFRQTALKPLFDAHHGTALVLDFDYFGNLTKSIIHQQLNLKFAYVLTTRFVQSFGFQKDGAWFYPRPETVAALTVEQLRELQFSGRKAEYIIGLANEIVEGRLELEPLKDASDEEVIAALTKVRGIGKWTAESFLLFALGRSNIFPKADIGIQNALKQIMQLEQKPTMEEMAGFMQAYEPYSSYAALYLWRSIEKRSEKIK